MTDHTLLNLILADKELKSVNCGCVVVDEAHERTVDTDVLMSLLTSATIDQAKFTSFF